MNRTPNAYSRCLTTTLFLFTTLFQEIKSTIERPTDILASNTNFFYNELYYLEKINNDVFLVNQTQQTASRLRFDSSLFDGEIENMVVTLEWLVVSFKVNKNVKMFKFKNALRILAQTEDCSANPENCQTTTSGQTTTNNISSPSANTQNANVMETHSIFLQCDSNIKLLNLPPDTSNKYNDFFYICSSQSESNYSGNAPNSPKNTGYAGVYRLKDKTFITELSSVITSDIEIYSGASCSDIENPAPKGFLAILYRDKINSEDRISFLRYQPTNPQLTVINTLQYSIGGRVLLASMESKFYVIKNPTFAEFRLSIYQFTNEPNIFAEQSSPNIFSVESSKNIAYSSSESFIYIYLIKSAEIEVGKAIDYGNLKFFDIQNNRVLATQIPVYKSSSVTSNFLQLFTMFFNDGIYLALVSDEAVNYFKLCDNPNCYSCRTNKQTCDNCDQNSGNSYIVGNKVCAVKNSYSHSFKCQNKCLMCSTEMGTCLACETNNFYYLINGECKNCADRESVPKFANKAECNVFKKPEMAVLDPTPAQEEKGEVEFLINFGNMISIEEFEFMTKNINISETFGVFVLEEDIDDLSIFNYRNFKSPPNLDNPNVLGSPQLSSRLLEEFSIAKNEVIFILILDQQKKYRS